MVRIQFSNPFLVVTNFCLGLPCGSFLLTLQGQMSSASYERRILESGMFAACLPKHPRSSCAHLHHSIAALPSQGFCPAPDIPCDHLMEACGKDLENEYLYPYVGTSQGFYTLTRTHIHSLRSC